MKYLARLFLFTLILFWVIPVFAQDSGTSALLDVNIVFALGWIIAAVAMVGSIYLLMRHETFLKDSLSPESIERVAKLVLDGAEIALKNAEIEAEKTTTPIDDWLVMTGKIGYDQALAVIQQLQMGKDPKITLPDDFTVYDPPKADAGGELSP